MLRNSEASSSPDTWPGCAARELLAVSDESLLQAGELLLSPWSASLCLQALEELLGALGLQAVLPLPVPLQCPQSVLPGAVARRGSTRSWHRGQMSHPSPCPVVRVFSAGHCLWCPQELQGHVLGWTSSHMSQLGAGSQHPGDSRWDTAVPFSSSGLEQCGLWHVRSYL